MAKPAAICRTCFSKFNNTIIVMVYALRTEVGTMRRELDEAKKHIQQLFTAQQELEQAYLKEKQ